MPKKRPSAVLVIAILNFVFAAWVAFGLLCAGLAGPLGNLAGGDPRQAQLQKEMERVKDQQFPAHRVVQGAQLGLSALDMLLLLLGGIGLLQMRSWGRTLSFIYAILAILGVLVGAALLFAVELPATQAALRAVADFPPELAQMTEIILIIAGVAVIVLGPIYPIAVLIVLTRPSVVAAFNAPDLPGVGRQADEDDYYDRGSWDSPTELPPSGGLPPGGP